MSITQTATARRPASTAIRPGTEVYFYLSGGARPGTIIARDQTRPGNHIVTYVDFDKRSHTVSAGRQVDTDGCFALPEDLVAPPAPTTAELIEEARSRGLRIPKVNERIVYRDQYRGELRAVVTAVKGVGLVSLLAFDPIRLARVRQGTEAMELDRWYAPSHQEVGWIPGVGDEVIVRRQGPHPQWGNQSPPILDCRGRVLEADGGPILGLVEIEQPRVVPAAVRGQALTGWRYPEDPAAEGVAPAAIETLRLPIEMDEVWLHLWDSRIGRFENVRAEITAVRYTESVDLFIPARQDASASARLGRGRTGDTLLRVSRGNCMNSWSYDRVSEIPDPKTGQPTVLAEEGC